MPSLPNPPAPAGPLAAARSFALAVAALTALPGAWFLYQNARMAYRWLTFPTATPQATEELMWPGYPGIVAWARQAGLQRLFALPYEANPYVYQRFIEMLYPIELVTVPESELKPGALVLVTKEKGLSIPHAPLFRSGDFALAMVTR